MDEESGTGEIVAGGALGILAALEAVSGAGFCPLCFVPVPLLVGVGLLKKLRCRKNSFYLPPRKD